jgi:mono/diheme cytochrome c family protein
MRISGINYRDNRAIKEWYMVRCLLNVALNLLLFACRCSAASPAAPKSGDLAAAARAVFAAKCVECHGAQLTHPEGRFGYVLDLARIAGNPEMVIRSSPDESELWELVRRDEMPPADASAGPLTREEKETIRSWIAAGAPGPTTAQKLTATPAMPIRKQPHLQRPNRGHKRDCR